MGGQLDAQIGGLPCPTPSCKPAGGRREVKTRLEEPGGGWRMEVLDDPFYFHTNLSNVQSICELRLSLERGEDCLEESESFHLNLLNFQSLVSCGLAGRPHVPVFSRVGGDEMNRVKVKVLSLFLDLLVNFS